VAELVVDEKEDVAAIGRDVVHVGRRQVRVAVTAQIGSDHLIPRSGEGPDVAPPDPLGLGVSVQ